MTGDDLITSLTEAQTDAEAREIIDSAPRDAVFAAADILHIDTVSHGMRWIRNAVRSEARA
jgi:hypothetical protein